MKKFTLLVIAMMMALADAFAQKEVSGVYVGGHIRRERPSTISNLRASGFTYVILFNVHVDPDGTLKTDGETICENGQYVFQRTQPYYQQDIRNLKTEPTSISRIDICIGGWGNNSYGNIKNLVASQGTGSNSILYKNFKALIEAVPEIDAVNNDTEQDYDVNSAAQFHIMMYDLGYKTTIAPYTYKDYWTQLVSRIRASRPKAVDRAMIQCYEGGAGNINNVGSWNFTGVSERHAGLQYYDNDWSVERNLQQFQRWKDDGVATGGFVWVYNDESWNLHKWACGMNRIFQSVPEDEVVIRCYSEVKFGGYCVSLPEGKYSQSDLAAYGLETNDLASMEILDPFYQVKLYTTTNCTGSPIIRRYSTTNKGIFQTMSTYNNRINSILIEPNPTAIEGIAEDTEPTADTKVYDLSGKAVNAKWLDGKSHGIYIVNGKKILR